MILFKEFKIEDWSEIEDAVEPFAPEVPLDALSRGISTTAVEDGEIMACGGIVLESETKGTIWCKVSKKCLRKSFRWARTMKEAFGLMMDTLGDVEISTYILKGFCKGDKLARLIGLKKTDETETLNGNTYYKYTAVI
ncbi:hypothetical protein LCGC14_1824090 [marine sediment metagenome]|uniref:N-acetyltransferase domain-containing protein n=1 Tax=marine sediment metagenome TaxID=412755 RepID=A0A0F9H687_9ZZZZ